MRVLFLLILLPSVAWAGESGEDIFMHGNDNGALPCAACHGMQGQGNFSIGAPALAGWPAGNVVAALQGLAKGTGGNPIMQGVAQALSPADMVAVGQYLASLQR